MLQLRCQNLHVACEFPESSEILQLLGSVFFCNTWHNSCFPKMEWWFLMTCIVQDVIFGDCVASSHDSTILLSIALNSSHIIYGTFGDIYQPQEKSPPATFDDEPWAQPWATIRSLRCLLHGWSVPQTARWGRWRDGGSFHGISKAMGDTPIAGCFYLGMGYPYFRKPPYESAWVK